MLDIKEQCHTILHPYHGTLWMNPESINKRYESESEVAQSCPTLCDLMDCSLPGSSVHGVFQARVLEWFAISFSRGSSHPRDRTQVSRTVGRCFTVWATREGAREHHGKSQDGTPQFYSFQLFWKQKHFLCFFAAGVFCWLSFEQSAFLWIIWGNLQLSVWIGKSLLASCKTPVFVKVHQS